MTKYLKLEYDQKDKINEAIGKIDSSKVIIIINSIKDLERKVSMLKIKITNRTNNENEVDDFINQLNDYLNLKS